jgi:hypothetical protein
MRVRFIRLLTLFAVLAAVFAGIARALDFEEEDPHPPAGEVGLQYSYEIKTTGGCLPHRLEVLSGELPPGTSLQRIDYSTHELTGVMTQAGTFSAWLAVRDCDNRSAELLFTFNVGPRRYSITTSALPDADVGAPYSATLQAGGLDANTTWEVTSGSLPAGLSLSKEGVISGTPTSAGSASFTVRASGVAKDGSGTRVDSKQLTVNVVALSAQVSRPKAEVGVRYSAKLLGSGGSAPYRWSATAVPAGLRVSPDGTIAGTPRRAGSYTFPAHIVDAAGTAGDVRVNLVVVRRLTLATAKLPAATAGRPYSATIKLRGGSRPFRWRASGLPAGLTLAQSGTVSGKVGAAGTFRVTLRVRDALGGTATKTLVLTVR